MKNNYRYRTLIPVALLAGILSGCQTQQQTQQPVAGAEDVVVVADVAGVGFPLIDIVDAEVQLQDNSRFAKAALQWERSAKTKYVGGPLDLKIEPKDLTIRLKATSIQIPIKEGEDLTGWFVNIPKGLKATAHSLKTGAKFAAGKGDTEITVTFEGIPEESIDQPIKIRVPYEKTNRSWDFLVPPDNDIRFQVFGADIEPVVVGGAVKRELDPKTFRIRFAGASLAATIPVNTDITAWFKENIPPGLKAVVPEETIKGQQFLVVPISGTPLAQRSENMNVVIPAGVTTVGVPVRPIELKVRPTDKARYDIGSYSAVSGADIEVRTDSNWKGVIPGWGLTGPQVFKLKDFSPVAIIQITRDSVYAMGDDGEFHWTGDTITYGTLMAEAKRLNAHAIIDVVIDSDDKVDVKIERRHVEANHTLTKREESLIETGKIKQEPDFNDPLGGQIYEERIEVIRRTWTGTALAIQYAPFYPVGGGTTGYVPAYGTESAADKR
jgi:hypothetical protein